MAAITAKFAADFSDFEKETKKAEAGLHEFEKAGNAAGRAITGLGDNGAKSIRGLQGSFSQFDSVLSAMGIHVGPVIKGIDEIAAASGKTAGQLGLLATAGLAVGAAFAGWKLGRIVADLAGTDQAIGNAVAKWMGWGDVAKETAGAVADSLALASERAQRPITDMNEALRINTDWLKAHKKEAKENREEQEKWEKATREVGLATQNWHWVLRQMNPEIVESAKSMLALGVAQDAIRDSFKISESQIRAVASALKAEEEQAKATAAAEKAAAAEVAAAMKEHGDAMGKIVDQIFGAESLKKATAWMDVMNTLGVTVENLRADELEELNATMLAGIDALARSGQLTSEQSSEFARLALAAQEALAAMKPVVTVTDDLAKSQWEYVKALDAELEALIKKRDEDAKQAAAAKGNAGPAAGLLPNAIIGRNGVATDMFGRPVAGYGAINNLPVVNVTVDGHIIGTQEQLAQLLGDALTSAYRGGGNRLPV